MGVITIELSRNIIKKYVEVATPVKITSNDKTVYGTISGEGDELYVKLDGSDVLTPISSTIDVRDGDRVLVLIKNHEAMVLGSPTSPTARLEELRGMGDQIAEFGVIIADKVGVGELVAMQALIDELEAKDVEITGKLEANEAEIDTLTAENATINGKLTAYQADIEDLRAKKIDATEVEAKYATIENLEATDLKVTNLDAAYGEFETLAATKFEAIDASIKDLDVGKLNANDADIKYATIESLNAINADVDKLHADVADIDTLIFGSASGTTIQTSFANAVIAQLGNAQIKSAMIDNISADKINAGDINTNNVRVVSEDGRLVISDETIQISDETRVRVQIGKDAGGDYSISIWDADGNLMFSEGGITDSAIKDAIIRNDMVANDANIAASKLDISSLFTEINNSTETINAGRVTIDTEGQTLDVAFTSMSSELDSLGETVSSQGTQLSVIQGQISSKIWQQDIEAANTDFSDRLDTLSTKQSSLEQTVDGLSATVSEYTTTIANKADSSEVTAVSDKVSELEIDLNGIKSTVSSTESEVSDLEERVSNAEATITQHTEAIELRVTKDEVTETLDNYYTKEEADAALVVKADEISSTVESQINSLEIGGRNILENSSFQENLDKWTYSGVEIVENDGVTCAHISGELELAKWAYQSIIDKIDATDLEQNYVYSADIRLDNFVKGTTNPYVAIYFSGQYTKEDGSIGYFNGTTVSGNPLLASHNNEGWVRLVWVLTFPYVATHLNAYIYTRDFTGDLYFKNLKLEKGNKATDWTPAPEDVNGRIDEGDSDVLETTKERITTAIQDSESHILTALESYSTTDSMEKMREELKAELAIMSDRITMTFNTSTEQITSVNDDLQSWKETYSKYISFDDDGITISSSDSSTTLQLDNVDGVVIGKDGTVQSQLVDDNFYTGNIFVEVDKYARFGGLRAEPREDGTKKSLMWVKVGV